jgi:hypothetical protein
MVLQVKRNKPNYTNLNFSCNRSQRGRHVPIIMEDLLASDFPIQAIMEIPVMSESRLSHLFKQTCKYTKLWSIPNSLGPIIDAIYMT